MENVTKNRDKYIGGSDLPKIIAGENLYKLALEKINPTFKGNEYTHYGQFMEPIIRKFINQQYDYEFEIDTVYKGFYRGNCDGIDRIANKLLEIKTFGSELDIRYYMPQIQAYLHIFNIPICILVGYNRPHNFFTWGDITNSQSYNLDFDEKRLDIYYVPKDENQWKEINKKATKFWNALEALREDNQLSEKHFNTIVYGSQIVDSLEVYQDSKLLEKLLEKHHIYQARIGNFHVKRTDVIEFGIDMKRLAEEMPEIFEKYKIINQSKKIQVRRKKNATN